MNWSEDGALRTYGAHQDLTKTHELQARASAFSTLMRVGVKCYVKRIAQIELESPSIVLCWTSARTVGCEEPWQRERPDATEPDL